MGREWSTTRPDRFTSGKELLDPEQSGEFEKRKNLCLFRDLNPRSASP